MQVARDHQSKMEEKRKKIAISQRKCNQKRRKEGEAMQVAGTINQMIRRYDD